MSVYGNKGDQAVNEDEQCNPRSFYGVGKLASEHYLRLYGLQYGIEYTSLRLFNVYGPGQNMENLRQGMVSIFMAQMLDKGHILVKGSPDRYRDFIYIDDVVDAFIACLDSSESSGKNINIGTGIKTTVGELLEQMIHLYGESVDIEYSGNTSGDIHGIYADNALMREVLGIEPRYTLADGLSIMLDGVKAARGSKV
jgi:UDP-glucose 4-epimerase